MEDLLTENIDCILSFFFFFFVKDDKVKSFGIGNIVKRLKLEFYYHRKKNTDKNENLGIDGEHKIARLLLQLPKGYYVFNDIVLLPTVSTNSKISTNDYHKPQIDHIVLSKFGVFTIETKNWQGKISGEPDSDNFIQLINHTMYHDLNTEYCSQEKYNTSNEYGNPIVQNNKHVEKLNELLGLRINQNNSIVVFTDRAESIDCDDMSVVCEKDLLGKIQSYQEIAFTEEELLRIGNQIVDFCEVGLIMSREFYKNTFFR